MVSCSKTCHLNVSFVSEPLRACATQQQNSIHRAGGSQGRLQDLLVLDSSTTLSSVVKISVSLGLRRGRLSVPQKSPTTKAVAKQRRTSP